MRNYYFEDKIYFFLRNIIEEKEFASLFSSLLTISLLQGKGKKADNQRE